MMSDSDNLLNWNEDFSVGVKELDKQHQGLFKTINRLNVSFKSPKDTEKILKIIQELLDYSVIHFKTEENYFEEFKYEHKASHIASHNSYKAKIDQFIADSKGNGQLSFDIMAFIKAWWVGHINGQDKLYIKCFHEHGLY